MNALDRIKAATWGLHTRAERSGIIADILAKRASRRSVALLLRNLLPVYQVLDASKLGHPILARSAAIEADLVALAPGEPLSLLAEGAAYAERVRQATEGDAAGLPGHAYVRYLGDLNGGQIMQRLLQASLGDSGPRLLFHDYPSVADKPELLRAYRQELDRAVHTSNYDAVLREALAGFEMNIAVSEAVKRHSVVD